MSGYQSLGSMVVWMMACPKDVSVLIPRTCEYVPSHGKGDFADVIELRILPEEDTLSYRRGPNVITRVLIRGQRRVKIGEGDVKIEAETGATENQEPNT